MESIKNYDLIEEGGECRMVASRDLAPGEVIFIEKPLVTGPGRNGYPVCVGCFQYPDGTSYCSKCGWQVQILKSAVNWVKQRTYVLLYIHVK